MRGRWFGRISLGELGRSVWRAASEDNVFGTSAELAFYFLLSLFPVLIFLASLVGFLPGLRDAQTEKPITFKSVQY